jgi:hypothetical protein
MASKKASKSTKRLKKAKKLEATKPLTVSSGGDRPTESVSLNFTKIQW